MGWSIGEHLPHPATSAGGTFYNDYGQVVTSVLVIIIAALVLMPVAAVGMALAWIVWKLARPTWLTACVMAVVGVLSVLVWSEHVAWLWPWGVILPGRLFGILPATSSTSSTSVLFESAWIEMCAGPVLLLALDGMFFARERTLTGGLFRQSEQKRRSEPVHGSGGGGKKNPDNGNAGLKAAQPYDGSMAQQVASTVDPAHPPDGIRLGVLKDNRRRPFDLSMKELGLHTFLPGVTGSGKTTTLERIADGAMSNGSGIIILDCKGGSLGGTARRLAARHGLPFVVVDPHDPESLGYEPCTGSPSDIANKIIGSFNYGEGGEIYKQVAMHAVPLIVQGLLAAGFPVTLQSIANSCDLNGLRVLARKVEQGGQEGDPERQALADELSNLLDDSDAAGKNGVLSLKHRFGAILQGEFGPLFKLDNILVWDGALEEPTVVYISLPVTAASEDVDLMGRILIQDLKQVCGRRLRATAQHPDVPLVPTLIAIDEFAALNDPRQIIDLLLQARQAALPLILASQVFPQDPDLRRAVMQVGLIVAHRIGPEDAEPMAGSFGTRSEWKVTYQTDWESGATQKGSIRDVQGYVVHPNVLRNLAAGQVAVRSVQTNRTDTVVVIPVTT